MREITPTKKKNTKMSYIYQVMYIKGLSINMR